MSEVAICNQALGWLGAELITSFTDNSVEARLCQANYPQLRDAVLEDVAWNFATKRDVLTPLVNAPAWGFGQAFQLPPDLIRILYADNTPNGFGNWEWARESDTIVGNADRVYLRYIFRETNTDKFPPMFTQALAQRLASDFAIPLAESRALQEQHWGLYIAKIDEAAASEGMQGRRERRQSSRLRGSRSGFYPGSRGLAIGNVPLDP